jgi:hypothetical protein
MYHLSCSLASRGSQCCSRPRDLGPLEPFRKADDRLYAAKLIQRNHRVVEQLTRAAVAPPGSN